MAIGNRPVSNTGKIGSKYLEQNPLGGLKPDYTTVSDNTRFSLSRREEMLQTLINAIKNRHVLSFTYDGYHRVVEPHAVGSSRAGNDVLRCYQTKGGHVTSGHDWDLCELSKILNLKTTGASFATARTGYRRGDKGMSVIYAEL